MPIKYAVPAGSARTRVLTALAARYTGGTVRGWDVLDGLDTHPASQNSGRFGYPFGKTRVTVSFHFHLSPERTFPLPKENREDSRLLLSHKQRSEDGGFAVRREGWN